MVSTEATVIRMAVMVMVMMVVHRRVVHREPVPVAPTAAAAAAAEAAAAEAAGAPARNPRAGVSCEHCRVLEGRQRRWRRYPRPLRVGTRVPAPKSVMTRCMCPLPPDSTPPVVMESPSAMRTDGASAETAAASAVESCASSTSSTKPAPDSTDPGELCLGAGQPGLGGSREEVGSPDAGNGAVSAAPSPPPPAAMRPSSSVEATLYGTCSVGSENGTGYVTSDGPSHAGNLPCQDLPTAPEALNAGGRVAACCTSLGGDLAGQVSPTAPVSRAATGLAAEGFGVSDGPRLRPAFPSDPLARRMAAGPPSSPRDDDEPPGPYDDPYEPIVETDSGGVIHIRAPGSGRRIRPRDAARVSPESMTLAATSTNVIDVAAIEEDHPDLAPLLALTHDVRAFEALFLPDAKSDRRRPLSRGMDHHYDDLGKYDIIETNPALTSVLGLLVVAWCTFFLVPKKIKTLGRLVIDARPINQRQRRPPPMGLPRMAQVIRTILSWEVAAKCDGKSFFYQFPLAGGIARYFRARIAGRRGKVIEVILKRLPMGWSFSPAIAQAVGNALTRALGLAWVDDFIIGGSRAEFEGRRAEFLRRLRRYNIEVDDETLEAAWELFALGLEFDLRRKRYRVDPAWITKRLSRWAEIRQRIETGHATFREIFELYGALIWADYVMEQPLWMRAEALAALSAIAKRARGRYDDPVPFPEYARRNLDDWMDGVAKNPWREPVERPSISDAEDILFSDASSTGGAWIRLFKDQIVDGDQWLHEEDLHIYLREVEAMCAAAKNSHPNARTLQVVDNTAAVGTANRGHSSSYLANVIMRETYGPRKPWVIWAPTDRQLADPFTRGEPIPTLPHPLLPQHRQVIASLDAQGQPDSKRKQPDQLHVISSFLDDTGTIRAR
mmetsp:Transcript_38200/g.118030  ORF Transcript_38200/g.118030 Transcript_38200/m.118030 type:complete len:894 (-) Transcript_38200:517-3198(-)